jgi:hypothetical protein
LPNGQYRDALNIQVASSDGDDVGAVQNILGNRARSAIGIAGAKCIGAIADTENEKIYWFIYGNSVDAIAEYDQIADEVKPVLVDTQGILGFSRSNQYRITAVNIIDGLLFFTDNKSEPKVINIQKFKGDGSSYGSINFSTHTTLLTRETGLASDAYNFTEEDITVIKKGPNVQPTLTMANTKRMQADGVTPGVVSGTVNYNFSDGGSPAALRPVGYNSVSLVFANPMDFQPGDILILGAGDDLNGFDDEYQVRLQVNPGQNGPTTYQCTIVSIGNNTPMVSTLWEVTLKQDDPFFEKEFVRFAYRYKYKDGEYSTFSPFTEVAFLPSYFEYDPAQGYNLGMVNDLRYLKISNFRPTDLPKQVEEIDILFKKENNNNVYVAKTVKFGEDEWAQNVYELETEMIYKTIESNQLLRPFDSVPKKAQCQELVANRLVYGNYTHNFNLTNVDGDDGTKIEVGASPRKDSSGSVITPVAGTPQKSLKSQRTYQVGVVYRDEYGRETPVQSDGARNSFTITKDDAVNHNQLSAKITTKPPTFAKSFKFFIKETANEYYNLAMDRWYDAEDGNVWLSFASSERNKVDEDTFLILKKKHDSNEFVSEKAKYKVISIENSAPIFIKEQYTSYGTMDTTFDSSHYPVPEGTFVDIDKDDFETRWGANSEILSASGLAIRFKSPNYITKYYDVSSIGLELNSGGGGDDQYRISIQNKFENDVKPFYPDGTYSSGVSDIEIEIARLEVKNKAEFTGRFFVKIYRDALLEEKILYKENEGNYSVKHQQSIFKRDMGCNASSWGDHEEKGANYRAFVYNYNPGCGALEAVYSDTVGGSDTGLIFGPTVPGTTTSSLPATYNGGVVKGRDTIAFVLMGARWKHTAMSVDNGAHAPFVNAMTTDGTKIRFTQDPSGTVYTIKKHARIGVRFFDKALASDSDWFRNKGLFMVAKLDKPIKTGANSFSFIGPAGNPDVPSGGLATLEILQPYSDENTFHTQNPAIWETEPKESIDLDLYYEASDAYTIDHSNLNTTFNKTFELNYSNCFSFANGVESNRIRDDFNTMTIAKGVKASAPLAEQYKEEVKKNGLIFSGIYNSTSGINRTNQFIIAEPITKDINPEYGSIQKIHQRDTDLTVCCEDKILKVLANKDALFEASGNPQLTATNRVLGQAVHYVGDFGISKNPESFANYGFRSYFTDRARGVVLRLSRDGLTPISQHGMVDYFRDNLATFNTLVGSYNDMKGVYNLTMTSSTNRGGEDTVSFKEQVTGWPSRKSFIPEHGLSLNNMYYTFKNGEIYSHDNPIRNTFYGASYRYNSSSTSNFEGSRLKLILNDSPNTIKSFKTISYEGTQSRIVGDATDTDTLMYNFPNTTAGWYINTIVSDKQSGFIPEFIEKEGKWFNYIKGDATTLLNLDSKEFNVQGIGNANAISFGDAQTEVTITIQENAD